MLHLFVFSCLFSGLLAQDAQPDMIIEVFRHGARAPSSNQYDSTWTNLGELTEVGMRMHYVLGKALALKYPNIFQSFDPSKIFVRSTDVNRTIMSVYSQLYGLFDGKGNSFPEDFPMNLTYPPYDQEIIDEVVTQLENTTSYLPFNYQAVPVHVMALSRDQQLTPGYACPNAQNWQNTRINDANMKGVFNSLSDITSKLKDKGIIVNDMWDYFNLGDTLACNIAEGKPLPGGIKEGDELFNGAIYAFEWFTNYMFAGAGNLIPTYSFALLDQINTWFNQKANGKTTLNAVLLSAHDTTLLSLLGAFGVVTPDCLTQNYFNQSQGRVIPYPNCTYPTFASQLIFELYNTSEPYIKVFYKGAPIPICGSNTCTLAKFGQYIQTITSGYNQDQFNNECGLVTPVTNDSSTAWAWIFGLSATVLTAAVLILYSQRRKGVRVTNRLKEQSKHLLP